MDRYRIREVTLYEVVDDYECEVIKTCKSRVEAQRAIEELTAKYYVTCDVDRTYVKKRQEFGDKVIMTFVHTFGVDSESLAKAACEMANLLDKME